ncbi:hypothetical protein [Nitrosopumilus sp. Nsub]|uniref:hypothetical protein n=1 Tax=Nitrosopumilus sp. Nsub TaxID=1776294 RepID=UPI000832812F|nr:hypothetical protein [Nitrosopumilus sp. Nsub]
MSTMKISHETKQQISNFRNYPKEPLEQVVKRMIETYEDDLILTDDDVKGIQKSLDDLKEGRVYHHEQIKKELGL